MRLNDISMKRKSIYMMIASFVTAAIVFAACTKDMSEVRLESKLTTTEKMDVTSDSATVVGFIVSEGQGFTEKGIVYSKDSLPTVDDNKAVYSGNEKTAAFTVKIGGLDYATKYYARAYGITSSGTIYGEQLTFTTLPVVPTVTTADITDVTGNSAKGGGEVTVSGGADVTARGVCFSTEHNPTLSNSFTTDGDSLGTFTSSLENLKGNMAYYVRAYATNSVGTGYGPEVTFKTLVDLPVVTTTAVTEITKVSAVSGGNVTYNGGADVTAKGLVWSETENPTITDNVIDGGTGTGAFTSNLSGLTLYTTYHVRAYATNSAGTAYGDDIAFTTLADITQMWVVGAYNGWDNSDAAEYIISTPTSGGVAEGYVYLTQGGIKLVTDHSWDDPHTFGDDGSGTNTLTNPGSDITIPADGYYLIKANLGDMSYSVTMTDWGVIGSATPNGWNDETALSYDQTSKTWRGVVHFVAGEYKFRANHSWDYNYGSDNADGTLQAGGANIAVDTESDYAIQLDLSHPNEYTYSVNRWGLIGSATPDGWNSDQNMTWDAVNDVFTITLDLTAGEAKFRANDDWLVDYGGDLNALTPGGANFVIDSDGNYTITFDPWGLTATITKN
jgi:hypothetical protein